MILCVALNAALDVTYTVAGVRWHAGNRVSAVGERAGGKGTNVARVLHALGEPVLLTGFVGGGTGELIHRDVIGAGIDARWYAVAGESRRTLTVVDTAAGDATGFWETGPRVTGAEWAGFAELFDLLAGMAGVVVLSGSTPPGLPDDAYARLIRAARGIGVPVVLDTDGADLRAGLAAGPAVVKPNRDELVGITGHDDLVAGAAALRGAGAGAVVVSAGPAGLLAVTPEGCWTARPPDRLPGNPTGAGDACVAALARGLFTGNPWPDRLVEAVALSAAAVTRPLAGEIDHDSYQDLRRRVRVEAFRTAEEAGECR
jgi:tagatose 6-phosphate kinase